MISKPAVIGAAVIIILTIIVPILNGVGRKYWINLLLGIDQFFNVLFGGDPDETMSSRLGKSLDDKSNPWIARTMTKACSWVLNKIDPNHCRDAIEKDEGKDSLF
jgi:hypothetical protein